jgi:phosphonoacetate hydrolase
LTLILLDKEAILKRRKVLIICIDAGGHDYLAASDIPNIRKLAFAGFYKRAHSVIPSVTNVNNVSIATGAFPATHGVTTNYHVDRATGKGEFVEDNRFLLAPTLFERAKTSGFARKTALLVTKKKLLRMLFGGADIAIAAEDPPPEYIASIGPAEDIYSAEINGWLLRALRMVLREHDPDLVYCSTTDWVQHKHAPEEEPSLRHMAELDGIIGKIVDDQPNREIYITADHGMLPKTHALDPGRWLMAQGIPAVAVPIIKDRYVAHHSNLGGAAYVFLRDANQLKSAVEAFKQAPGVEEVYASAEAAAQFQLHPERIGDIFLLADRRTVFGELNGTEIPVKIRSHGSRHESEAPIIGYNSPRPADDFVYNVDVGRWLLEDFA